MERYDLTQDETGVSNLSKACTKSHFSADRNSTISRAVYMHAFSKKGGQLPHGQNTCKHSFLTAFFLFLLCFLPGVGWWMGQGGGQGGSEQTLE